MQEEIEHQQLNWAWDFQIQSAVDLDFVIGQDFAQPIGMERKSPPELRRRVVAAAISYRLGIKSVDYTLRKYVDSSLYDDDKVGLGDFISKYIADKNIALISELRVLHDTRDITFGRLGAELTFYKIPSLLNLLECLQTEEFYLEYLLSCVCVLR